MMALTHVGTEKQAYNKVFNAAAYSNKPLTNKQRKALAYREKKAMLRQ